MRNHAHAVVVCDFFTVVTARFHVLYMFVALEVGTRRILHWNVTAHPTAAWTIQQFRAFSTPETSHRVVLHDRDSILAATVDQAIASIGRHVLKTPVRTPQANAFCERLIGTMRRECLDWLIPLHERHPRWILREWVTHDNRGRPHASVLGHSRPADRADAGSCPSGPYRGGPGARAPILGGLHHEYRLTQKAA